MDREEREDTTSDDASLDALHAQLKKATRFHGVPDTLVASPDASPKWLPELLWAQQNASPEEWEQRVDELSQVIARAVETDSLDLIRSEEMHRALFTLNSWIGGIQGAGLRPDRDLDQIDGHVVQKNECMSKRAAQLLPLIRRVDDAGNTAWSSRIRAMVAVQVDIHNNAYESLEAAWRFAELSEQEGDTEEAAQQLKIQLQLTSPAVRDWMKQPDPMSPDEMLKICRLVNHFHEKLAELEPQKADEHLARIEQGREFDELVEMMVSSSDEAEAKTSHDADQESKAGCFIATACYGSDTHPDVIVLRRYRDVVLEETLTGKALVRCYYLVAPFIARGLTRTPLLVRLIRVVMLSPLLRCVRRRLISEHKKL